MKIAFLIGTRPEVIKISPAIRECQKRGIDFFIISSNQHYDDKLFSNFLKELGFPEIKYKVLDKFELHNCYDCICKLLIKNKPDFIWVGGDTDTALVGALAGWDAGVPVIHREAGVRSFDRRMHEEKNRIMIDKLSAIRFAPTEIAVKNLNNENIKRGIYLTGNLIADAVQNIHSLNIGKSLGSFIYLTIHRQENIAQFSTLVNMIQNTIYSREGRSILFPVHPKVEKLVRDCFSKSIDIVDPLSYAESIKYIKYATYIVTDSGGIQEEACILGTPCVVLRKTSDRPETIDCGAAILIDPDSKDWNIKFKKKKWKHPYGSSVAKKMFDILEEL